MRKGESDGPLRFGVFFLAAAVDAKHWLLVLLCRKISPVTWRRTRKGFLVSAICCGETTETYKNPGTNKNESLVTHNRNLSKTRKHVTRTLFATHTYLSLLQNKKKELAGRALLLFMVFMQDNSLSMETKGFVKQKIKKGRDRSTAQISDSTHCERNRFS